MTNLAGAFDAHVPSPSLFGRRSRPAGPAQWQRPSLSGNEHVQCGHLPDADRQRSLFPICRPLTRKTVLGPAIPEPCILVASEFHPLARHRIRSRRPFAAVELDIVRTGLGLVVVATHNQLSAEDYGPTLYQYLRTRSEEALYNASLLSQIFVESGLGPEDIIALHFEALGPALEGMPFREQGRAIGDAHQFLLEIMIVYGIKHKEYLEAKLTGAIQDAELRAIRERERAVEAERLQRAKSEILGVIAHELRTPISVIMGRLDLASRSLSRGEIERLPSHIKSAREALDRLSRLSADLVEASRNEPPKLQRAPLELSSIAAQACSWARAAGASAKNIELTIEGDIAGARVNADPDAMLSVFGNLLSNAIRYTPIGGKVVVRQSLDDDVVWVEVADTGIGMTPEVQSRVFEKFYRGPDAREFETGGLGLGLSLVQQLVQAHDGRVEVESVPGQGSRFRVGLPLLQE